MPRARLTEEQKQQNALLRRQMKEARAVETINIRARRMQRNAPEGERRPILIRNSLPTGEPTHVIVARVKAKREARMKKDTSTLARSMLKEIRSAAEDEKMTEGDFKKMRKCIKKFVIKQVAA